MKGVVFKKIGFFYLFIYIYFNNLVGIWVQVNYHCVFESTKKNLTRFNNGIWLGASSWDPDT